MTFPYTGKRSLKKYSVSKHNKHQLLLCYLDEVNLNRKVIFVRASKIDKNTTRKVYDFLKIEMYQV